MEIIKYISAFVILTAAGMLYDRYKKKYGLDIELNNKEKIQKFLLNDDSLINGKPILWIHNDYEINSRNWASFNSRNSKELNQPYLSLCIETLIKTCSESFNICIIDDNSFALIPNWCIDMDKMSGPIKEHIRLLGILKVLYYYGGIRIPNSMIMLKNLEPLYNNLINKSSCFSVEMVNRNKTSNITTFFPNNKIIGCIKNSSAMKKILTYFEKQISIDNTNALDFKGNIDRYIYKLSTNKELYVCNGKYFGIKDINNKPVLIEDLFNNEHINFDKDIYGIYIPSNNILKRVKYQWFARLNKKQVLNSNNLISKYLILVLGKYNI